MDDVEPDMPRWTVGHDSRWLRIACHAWYRMLELCSLDVPPRFIRHDEYDQSPLRDYINALTPELRTTDLSMPFADIVKMPTPDAFGGLFEQDKQTWLSLKEKA